MRDFAQMSPDDEREDAQTTTPLKRQARTNDAATATDEANTELLGSPHLSHPANAEQLAELLAHLQQTHGNAYVQRLVAGMRGGKTAGAQPREQSAQSDKVQPLDSATRAEMEANFDESFSDVRLHTGQEAARISEEMGAAAFTRGRDIYFAEDQYDPSTREGREVLAHELAHVAQQSNRKSGAPSSSREESEEEAHRIAPLVAAGQRVHVEQAVDPSAVRMIGPSATRPPTPVQNQPAPVQNPPAPAPAVTLTLNITPAISAAVMRFLNERAFEQDQIELYVAPEHDRWRVLMNVLMRFPAAWQDVRRQQPANMDQAVFLRAFGNLIWEQVRDAFLHEMERRYRTDAEFRRRVNRARRRMETPVNIPPGSDVA